MPVLPHEIYPDGPPDMRTRLHEPLLGSSSDLGTNSRSHQQRPPARTMPQHSTQTGHHSAVHSACALYLANLKSCAFQNIILQEGPEPEDTGQSQARQLLCVASRAETTHKGAAILICEDSTLYRCWWALTAALTYVTCFAVPFGIAFQQRKLMLQLFLDFVFSLDVCINFFIPRYYHEAVAVTHREIASAYVLGGMFWIDLLAALPLDRMLLWWIGWQEGLLLVGLLRFLRLKRVVTLMDSMERNIGINYYLAVLFRLISILVICSHLEACGFWYLAYLNDFDVTTWATHFGEYHPGQSIWDSYLSSLYWTYTTLSTTGYGDLTPINDLERMYTVAVMFLNIGLTAYIVGNMTMLATKADMSSLEYREIVSQLRAYMDSKGMDQEVTDMALQHFKLKHEMKVERDDILQHCAPYIRNVILSRLYKTKLMTCELFKGTSERYLDQLSQSSSMEFIYPFSTVLTSGERSSHLYYILSGSLEVYSKDGHHLRLATEGTTLGDEGALCDFPSAYTFRSETLTKVLMIPVSDIQTACRQSKLDHRISCANLQRLLRGLDPCEEPDAAERIQQVSSLINETKTSMVTKLCYASANNDSHLLNRLLSSDPEHNIDMGDYDGRRPIHVAAAYGRLEILKFLVDSLRANIDVKDVMGGTPLLDAVKNGHRDAAELLRSRGASLMLEDTASTLCNCVFRGKADLLESYLEFGAEPSEGDYDMRTPLHIACAEGLLPMVKVLIHYGADMHARDRWGETPKDEARKNAGQQTVASYLDNVLEMQQSGHFKARRVSTTGPAPFEDLPPPFRDLARQLSSNSCAPCHWHCSPHHLNEMLHS